MAQQKNGIDETSDRAKSLKNQAGSSSSTHPNISEDHSADPPSNYNTELQNNENLKGTWYIGISKGDQIFISVDGRGTGKISNEIKSENEKKLRQCSKGVCAISGSEELFAEMDLVGYIEQRVNERDATIVSIMQDAYDEILKSWMKYKTISNLDSIDKMETFESTFSLYGYNEEAEVLFTKIGLVKERPQKLEPSQGLYIDADGAGGREIVDEVQENLNLYTSESTSAGDLALATQLAVCWVCLRNPLVGGYIHSAIISRGLPPNFDNGRHCMSLIADNYEVFRKLLETRILINVEHQDQTDIFLKGCWAKIPDIKSSQVLCKTLTFTVHILEFSTSDICEASIEGAEIIGFLCKPKNSSMDFTVLPADEMNFRHFGNMLEMTTRFVYQGSSSGEGSSSGLVLASSRKI